MPLALTTESFKIKANIKHKNAYTYLQTVYLDHETPVKITCPDHGVFEQTPHQHLRGKICFQCGVLLRSKKLRLTLDQFIQKAKSKHPQKGYIYTEVIYVNNTTKVTIVCPEHGNFSQTPSAHLMGQGCPECGRELVEVSRRHTKDSFVNQANETHKSFYIYTLVEYKNNTTKVLIVCPKHGDFWQTPASHLKGSGCSKCSFIATGDRCRSNSIEFEDKAKLVHRDFYDYSKVEYISTRSKVCIICPKHGEFLQRPEGHLRGDGCPSCAGLDPKWQRSVEEWMKSIFEGQVLYNDRTTIKHPITGKFWELDIYMPQIKIAFECQGDYYHDEDHFPGVVARDAEKAQLCIEAGITLVCIWENEWADPQARVLIENQIRTLTSLMSSI